MSFTNAPVSRTLVIGLVGLSIVASLLDIKHYFYILIDTHIWRYRQGWRILLYQLCFTNSSEALFGAILLYNLRAVERMWGPRKFASFVIISGLVTAVLTPALLTFILRPLSGGLFNYLPAGPLPVIFAILAQYHAVVPRVYQYRLAFSPSPPTNDEFMGLVFSDKSTRYFMAIQLALAQWPGSILSALVGWVVGYSWRNDLLPGPLMRWRVPGWVVGIRRQKRAAEFEGLRRRLEDENNPTARSSAVLGDGEAGRRRNVGQHILEQVREAL